MATLGYEHQYCRNAGLDGQPLSPQGRPTLGNAIFYKPSVFRCEKVERVSYAQQIAAVCPKRLWNHFTHRKEQVALIIALRHVKTGRRVVTATTHITADFTHKETQLAQVQMFLDAVTKIVAEEKGSAVLLPGDFNAQPDEPTYKLISNGTLPMKLPFASLQHRLRLQSAYSQAQGAEPEITNSLGGERQFEGCLDYIWLSESLRATAVLPVPTVAEARLEGGALPNSRIPSDHLPIGARISFVNGVEESLTPLQRLRSAMTTALGIN